MQRRDDKDNDRDQKIGHDDDARHAMDEMDEQEGEADTFNPRTGEDPGLLELTEDPHERRLKRTTM